MIISEVRLHPSQEGYIIVLDGQHEYACPPGDPYYEAAKAMAEAAQE